MDEFEEKERLNEKVLGKLKTKIIMYERENYKTKKYTDSELITRIKKAIDEAVRTEEEI